MQRNLRSIEKTAYETLIQEMNDIMVLHNVIDNCSFTDDKWQFESNSIAGIFELDFSLFSFPLFNGEKVYKVVCHGAKIELTNQEFAKVLFLEHLDKSATLYYYHRNGFNFIAKVCSFLKIYNVDAIDKNNVQDFYSYAFSHKVHANNIVKSFSPPAFQSLSGSALSLNNLVQYLKLYNVEGLIGGITIDTEQEALNTACSTFLGMNLSEYQNGDSFNYLGLDIGKHYIDHCGSLFEENIQYAIAARITLNETIHEVQRDLEQGNLESIQPIVAQALMGEKLTDLPDHQVRVWSKKKLEQIYDTSLKNFIKNYNQFAIVTSAFKLDVINEVIAKAKLPDRYDAQEFVRSILFARLNDKKIKKEESIFKEYLAVLKAKDEDPDIDFKKLISICNKTLNTFKQTLPNKPNEAIKLCQKHSSRICIESKSDGVRKFKAGLNMVMACGATLVVGLLGWRRSEFGFSLNNINLKINETVSDNFYTSLRFMVNWTVEKTSGKTKLDREITQYAYIVIDLLAKLNESESNLPAIYFASKSRSKGTTPSSDSSMFITNMVDYAWPDFIRNYSEKEKIINGNNEQLRIDFEKLEEDLPIYILCQTNNSQSFITKIELYRNRELPELETKIFDDKLTLKTKEMLNDASIELTPSDITKIRSQLLQDVAYPTPHAFRHIWAEAALRRYRGDIGKFIRANFKHLDESFFMAYLRDKETSAFYQIAKRTVIKDIVRQQLLSLTNNDRIFAGAFDHMLTKAVHSTKVVSHEEYIALSNKISEERIINISPRPWVTCMLRVNTERFAKCSEDGVPQPHKAEPKFCLGCINANISEGNYNGIMFYISTDIKACRNAALPNFIREMHEPVVRDALKRIRELARNTDKYKEFIEHLEETLNISEQLNRAA